MDDLYEKATRLGYHVYSTSATKGKHPADAKHPATVNLESFGESTGLPNLQRWRIHEFEVFFINSGMHFSYL